MLGMLLVFALFLSGTSQARAGQLRTKVVVFFVGYSGYLVVNEDRSNEFKDFDVAAFVYNDRVYVPVRPLLNALGVPDEKIAYDGRTVKAKAFFGKEDGMELEISLDEPSLKVNGVPCKTYGPPVVRNGRTCLPVREIAEAMHSIVFWKEPEGDDPGEVYLKMFPWNLFQSGVSRSGADRGDFYGATQTAKQAVRSALTLADVRLDYPAGENYGSMDNAVLAAQRIDGTVLQPGEIFSFNAATGPRTEENGFTWGLGFAGPDVGSGVCRAATVLYQAAREAGLEIVERSTHVGGDVPYASHDDDAAVQWGVADLKFRNSCGFPVRIRIRPESENSLRAQIVRLVN